MKKTAHKAKQFAACFLALLLTGTLGSFCTLAKEQTVIIAVDSVNGTRWEDTLAVYRDRATTEQNEWGWNVVVGADGKAAEKIAGGDARGKNLAIPEGGFVVSGTGEKGKTMYDSIEVGDNVVFDEYGMRVLASAGEIDPFYETEITFTGYNAPRYSNTLIVYNKAGTTTATNGYGYEVTVNADGCIVSAGGNDSLVPEGGYVLSAIEPADKNLLKTYCIPGAKCEIVGKTVKVVYNEAMLAATVQNELHLLEEELSEAEKELRLIDYAGIQARIDALSPEAITTLAQRDDMLAEIESIGISMIEARTVEVRSVWYVPLERTAEDIDATVAEMKRVGINQLCLGIISGGRSIVKVSDEHPFQTDARLYRLDIVQAYVDACKENGIELVLSVPIFHGQGENAAYSHWLTLTNTGEVNAENFVSPANEEFCGYMMEYLEYIVRHYDIDGLQYDYIRYPYFDGVTDFGYDSDSVELFLEETGCDRSIIGEIGSQLTVHPKWDEWVNFKISLIDRRVKEFSDMIRTYRPDLYISAAIANDTAPANYCQNATHWIENGTVDGIYPMSYAEGIMQSATQKFSGFLDDRTFLVMGNGAYQSLTLDEMYLQTKQTALYGADGIAFFEWGAYVSHGYAEAFSETVFASPALSFTYAESESIAALVETAKERLELWYSNRPNTDHVFPSELFENDASLTELYNGIKAISDDAYLLQDLELALRIEKMSKEDKKGGDYLTPIEKDDTSGETSGAVSESIHSAEESMYETKPGKRFLPWVIGGIAVVLLIAVGAFVAVRKRG